MKLEQLNDNLVGIVSAGGAFLLWGVLPVYWKLVDNVPAPEILAHRIVWSFFLMLCGLLVTKRIKSFGEEFRQIIHQPTKLAGVMMGSLMISLNWCIYIWAVNDNRVVETSLGYYINPLVSVLLGIIVLKEKLSLFQVISFLLALLGVLNMVFHLGTVPWVSLLLAISFALYGLYKKMVNLGAITSITLETLIVSPIALLYLIYIQGQGSGAFSFNGSATSMLLVGAGAVTAIPLMLFSKGANHLSLKMLGFLQYLSPTIALFLGVFLYHEPFTAVHLISFGCIWLALIIFSLSKTKLFLAFESTLFRRALGERNRA